MAFYTSDAVRTNSWKETGKGGVNNSYPFMEQAQPSLDPVQQSLSASDQELYLARGCCSTPGLWGALHRIPGLASLPWNELNAHTPPWEHHGWVLRVPEKWKVSAMLSPPLHLPKGSWVWWVLWNSVFVVLQTWTKWFCLGSEVPAWAQKCKIKVLAKIFI